MKEKKIGFLQLLRVLACFLVIVNHTNSKIFLSIRPSPTWFFSLIWFFLSKTAVPIFVMITGYLMLDRETDYGKTLRSIFKTGTVLVLFSLPYYLFVRYPAHPSLLEFAKLIYQKPITNAFWYLYFYLGLLVMIPFLQKMVKNFERRDFHIFFAISGFFIMLFPVFVHYKPALQYSGFFALPLMNANLTMLMMGLYWKRYPMKTRMVRVGAPVLLALCTAVNVVLTYLEYQAKGGSHYLFLDRVTGITIVLSAAAIFTFVSTFSWEGRADRIIACLGSATFGIYLLSDLMIFKLRSVEEALHSLPVNPLVTTPVFQILIFAVCLAVTLVLKKLPVFRKLI